MKKNKVNNVFVLVLLAVLIFLLSFLYALSLVPSQTVFGFDQARDAYEAFAIWHDHDIKILGPSSDITGINHGVLWYYVLAFAYFLGGGIPENAVYIFLVGLYALIPLIGYCTYKMSKSTVITSATLMLYAMSPLYLSFTHWLSNPLLSLFITPPLFYLLWKYIYSQSGQIALLVGLLYALLIQSDFGFIVLLFAVPIYFFAFALRFSFRNLVYFSVGLLAGLLPFFVTYVKFKTDIVGIIAKFVFSSSGKDVAVTEKAFGLIDNVVRLLTFTYFPLPPLLVFFFLLFVGIYFHKSIFGKQDAVFRLAIIWLSGIVFIFIFNHGNLLHTFFYGPFLYPLALFVSVSLIRVIKDTRWVVAALVIIVIFQFAMINAWAEHANSPLAVQQGMTIQYERELIDYVYQSANKQPFVISTVTNPLYINTTWSYLFNFYGRPKYGYVPYFWGKDQKGYLEDLPMQEKLTFPVQRYLIIEPHAGISKHWMEDSLYQEDLLSDVIEEKKFGNFTVQKRLFHLDKGLVATPEALLKR